jgi:sugar transferase (PEP-CTERM/EpsH1 system associated)
LVAPEPEKDREGRLQAVRSFCARIETVPQSSWRRLWRLSLALWTSLPLQTLYFFDPRFRQEAETLLREQPFDVVHVQLARMAPVVYRLSGIPKVIDLVDALSLNMARRARLQRGPQSWIAAHESRRLRRYERLLVQDYDQVVVSSSLDRVAIGGCDNIHVVPNGVDLETHRFVEQGRDIHTLVFTGRLGYFPNADAAAWFAAEVFPLLRQEMPQVRFLVVGADPTSSVRRLGRCPGVEVVGLVPSVPDYLSRAAVAVAPMRSGSGVQNKVLEAFACGTPVVATPYALGGLEAADGEHLLVAQDARVFAEQVVRLLKDPLLARRLARNARQLVEEKYTWERTVGMLEEVYRRAAGSAAVRG